MDAKTTDLLKELAKRFMENMLYAQGDNERFTAQADLYFLINTLCGLDPHNSKYGNLSDAKVTKLLETLESSNDGWAAKLLDVITQKS